MAIEFLTLAPLSPDSLRGIAAVIAKIPYNGFPKRKQTRRDSGRKSEVKIAAAIFCDTLRAKLHLKPYYIQMVGGPGVLAGEAGEDDDRR